MKIWSKKPLTWAFWYGMKNSNNRIVLTTFECKQPERTNAYKAIQKQYQKEGVVAVGWTTVFDDPFLVWPQSTLPMTNAMLDEMNRRMEEGEAEDMAMYS